MNWPSRARQTRLLWFLIDEDNERNPHHGLARKLMTSLIIFPKLSISTWLPYSTRIVYNPPFRLKSILVLNSNLRCIIFGVRTEILEFQDLE